MLEHFLTCSVFILVTEPYMYIAENLIKRW